MKKIFFFLLLFLVGGLLPLQAQWQRGVKNLKNISRRTPPLPARAVNLAIKRAQRQAILQAQSPHYTKQKLKKSTLVIENSDVFEHWGNIDASAFVIAETYRGKNQLWGVSVSHYRFEKPTLTDPRTRQEIPISLLAQGSYGFNDVTLFPIPQSMQDLVTPLPLATHPVQVGEDLHSVGYFDNEFQLEKHRQVLQKSDHLIVTSLQVFDKLSREGACGGPVLNKKEEVVGIHVGSSERRQFGFVIPVEHIREVLRAYHNHGKLVRPIIFNGVKLGSANIDEHIHSLSTWKNNHVLQEVFPYQEHLPIDYSHLEKMIDISQADKLVLVLEQNPFSSQQPDQSTHYTIITYQIREQKIEVQKNVSSPFLL